MIHVALTCALNSFETLAWGDDQVLAKIAFEPLDVVDSYKESFRMNLMKAIFERCLLRTHGALDASLGLSIHSLRFLMVSL